jgi:hypothetical protein
MRRRSLLAGLVALLPAGCTATPADEPDRGATATATPAPEDRLPPDDGPSPTPPRLDVSTPRPGECEPTPPPAPASTGVGQAPRPYPDRPEELTADSVSAYLTAYERAYRTNEVLAARRRERDLVVAAVRLDDPAVTVRATDDGYLAGVHLSGSLSYAPALSPVTPETPTRTPTAVPSVTLSTAASYLLTDRFLVRQDRPGRDAPAAVTGGTVVECF